MRSFSYTPDAVHPLPHYVWWDVSVLFYMRSLSYTACAVLYGECVLHTLCYLMCGICPTYSGLFYVGNLSGTPYSILCGEFVLHTLCYFMWGVSYMPHAVLCGEFLLHTPCCFMWGVGVGGWGGGILLHGPCYFMWGVSFTWPMLFYVGNFSYTLRAVYVGFSLTLLVLIFMQEVCFPCPMLFDIRNFSYTSYASLCGEIF